MDYKYMCKGRHLVDVHSQLIENMVFVELQIAKCQNDSYTCNPR